MSENDKMGFGERRRNGGFGERRRNGGFGERRSNGGFGERRRNGGFGERRRNGGLERWRRERWSLMWWLIGLYAMVTVVVCLSGCAPRVTSDVREVRTDTVYVGHQTRDSIWVHDSLYIHEYARGETIYVDRTRWREYYGDRWKRDTVYECRMDTCIVYREVIKEPTMWERWRRTAANAAGTVAAVAAVALLLWLLWKRYCNNQ